MPAASAIMALQVIDAAERKNNIANVMHALQTKQLKRDDIN